MFRRIVGFLSLRLTQLRMDDLPDPRDARGRRWSLKQILTVSLVGLMAGCKSLAEVESLTADLSRAVRRKLGIPRRVPDTTLRDVLCRLSHDDILPLLERLVTQLRVSKSLHRGGFPLHVAALDGRGTALTSWAGDFAQRHLNEKTGHVYGLMRTVTATVVTSPGRPCIHVSPIPAGTNEMGHFQEALRQLCEGPGRFIDLVTYDQGANSRGNAQAVLDRGKHYLMRMNDARRSMQQLTDEMLGTTAIAATDAETIHNRKEVVRSLRLMPVNHTALPQMPRKAIIWEHARTLLRVDSQTLVDGEVQSQLTRFFVSSLPAKDLTPEQWLWLTKAHWGVETTHQVLDQSFEEDDHPWMTNDPNGMLVVAVLRRIALTLLTMFRAVTLKSDTHRAMPWKRLFGWVRNTLIASTEATVASLRQRRVRVATL
jgi:hypothetical protein